MVRGGERLLRAGGGPPVATQRRRCGTTPGDQSADVVCLHLAAEKASRPLTITTCPPGARDFLRCFRAQGTEPEAEWVTPRAVRWCLVPVMQRGLSPVTLARGLHVLRSF